MEQNVDIKTLIKLSKKEEKYNPEFLYQLGLRFKNGIDVKPNISKAVKYFTKASKLNHVQAHIELGLYWWQFVKAYAPASEYFQKAINKGNKEAKDLLLEMQNTLVDKDNPVFLYKEGMRLLNDEITTKNLDKATEYLHKAGTLNYDDAKLEYGRHFSKRYYLLEAEFWLKDLADKKYKDAKEVLADLLKIKQKDVCIEPELYEIPKFKDDGYTSFIKEHTLLRCPRCRASLSIIDQSLSGDTLEEYVKIYDPNTIFERYSNVLSRPSPEGLTVSRTFKCDFCNLTFEQHINTRLEERDADPNVKEILGSFVGYESGRTKWARLCKITYDCHTPNVTKDTLRIFNKFSGSYDEDKI